MIEKLHQRLLWVGTMLALLPLLPLINASGSEPERPPNIVFILADDLGYGEVGYNGQSIHQTPNIDRLASEGLRFTQHYAGSAVCAPSRCVLLTGRDTGKAQIRDNIGLDPDGREIRPALAEGTVTVARHLQSAGYTTACIGKWGQGDEGTSGVPWLQGFDHFFGYLHNTHGTRYYTEFIYRNKEKIALRGNYGNWRTQYGPDLLIDEALRFLEENRDRPFFLYFPTNLVHGQYIEPPPDPDLPPLPPPSGVTFSEKERTYIAMVRRLDHDIGRLVARIDRLGLGHRTLILFTTDNGNKGIDGPNSALLQASGGLRGGKAYLYEGGIRVPTIARWTRTLTPGGMTDHVSGFVDFLATAGDLAGLPVTAPTEGISYAPLLLGGPQPEHEHLYWELAKRDEPWVIPQQAVRAGPWKLVRQGDDPPQLFHLGDDPAESTDRSHDQPEVAARLLDLMIRSHTEDPRFPLRAGPGFE